MIKAVLFDVDGLVNDRPSYFSQACSEKFGVPYADMLPFFENEFLPCMVGKSDLKAELQKYLTKWKWDKSVEELLRFWFEHEGHINPKVLEIVASFRNKGIKCYLQTRNEKYRTEYLWNDLQLKDHFDGVFSSAYLGFMKPDIKFWEAIYKDLSGLEKQEILVWDDKQVNVDTAKGFGFQAKLYTGNLADLV